MTDCKGFWGIQRSAQSIKILPYKWELSHHAPLPRAQQLDMLIIGSILANSAQCLKQKQCRRKFLNSRWQALLSEHWGHGGEQSMGFHQLSSAANEQHHIPLTSTQFQGAFERYQGSQTSITFTEHLTLNTKIFKMLSSHSSHWDHWGV